MQTTKRPIRPLLLSSSLIAAVAVCLMMAGCGSRDATASTASSAPALAANAARPEVFKAQEAQQAEIGRRMQQMMQRQSQARTGAATGQAQPR